MATHHTLIEEGIPDLIVTDQLPTVVAAEIDFLAGRFAQWTDRGGPMLRARAWVGLGGESEAAALVDALDASALEVNELAAGAWAVARIGPRPAAAALLDALRRESTFLAAGDVPLGPRALAEGPLLAALGDLAGAEARLGEAVVAGDARAPLWGALARVELARVKISVRTAGNPEDAAAGHDIERLLDSATLFFRAGGYRSMLSRIAELVTPPGAPVLGAPNVGRLLPGRPWRVGFGVVADVPLRRSKGLVAIRHLVQNPGRPIPAIELDRLVNGGSEDPTAAARLAADPGDASVEEIRATLFDETVRSRVGKLLNRAVRRLEDEQPLLGAHLRVSLRIGHVCRYDPSDAGPVVWRV